MQLPLALATACVLLLAPPWGVRADDFEDVSPAAMLKAAAGRVPRHVLAVGVEGSGHHLVKSLTSETALVQDDCRPDIFFAWNLADDRAQGRSSEMGHAKAYEFIYPQLDSSVLERILLSVYGGKDVLHNSDSYPMVTSVLTHHPDLIAFAAMTKVTPVLLFLRRNLADAALSGRRRHRKTVAIGAELARVEMEAALIEAQYVTALLLPHCYYSYDDARVLLLLPLLLLLLLLLITTTTAATANLPTPLSGTAASARAPSPRCSARRSRSRICATATPTPTAPWRAPLARTCPCTPARARKAAPRPTTTTPPRRRWRPAFLSTAGPCIRTSTTRGRRAAARRAGGVRAWRGTS